MTFRRASGYTAFVFLEARAMTEAEWIAFFRRPEIPAFNAAMLEHPDADLPRLVFADGTSPAPKHSGH